MFDPCTAHQSIYVLAPPLGGALLCSTGKVPETDLQLMRVLKPRSPNSSKSVRRVHPVLMGWYGCPENWGHHLTLQLEQ